MPPKKATGATKSKAAPAPAHASYKDMIKEAIIALKERNGSSRSALKKYVQANNASVGTGTIFDNQFNRAIKSGVEKGEFAQPKGPSGTVKLQKKDKDAPAAKPATMTKKPSAAKEKSTKAAAPKTKKAGAPKKAAKAAPKKTTSVKKPGPKPKTKANTSTKRKTPAPAPAIVDEKKVLGKTKSGRVTKGPAKTAIPKKSAAKKTPKKSKTATPKKTATPAAAS